MDRRVRPGDDAECARRVPAPSRLVRGRTSPNIPANTAKRKLIPAPESGLILLRRPVHPRALREASLSGTGWRWPRKGATRTPNARRPKLRDPDPSTTGHGVLGSGAVTPCQRLGAVKAQQRWLKRWTTGGRAEQASNTVRGTLERRRTCGLSIPERLGAATHRGPWVHRSPGVPRAPRTFRDAQRLEQLGCKRIARIKELV
jgi:hypothetical protein